MPRTWGVYTDLAATCRIQPPAGVGTRSARKRGDGGRGRGRGFGRIMWRSAWFMRAGRAEKRRNFQLFTSAGRERGTKAGRASSRCRNERKRKGGESAYAYVVPARGWEPPCGERQRVKDGGQEKGGRTFACLRRFRAVSGNKRQTRMPEKVLVARFARVQHLTKKSNIYFSAGARNISRIYLFFLRRCAATERNRGTEQSKRETRMERKEVDKKRSVVEILENFEERGTIVHTCMRRCQISCATG